MQVLFNGKVIGKVLTNHSITLEEAIYALGYDVNDPVDLKKAYDDDFPAAYLDDDGFYQIDTDAMDICGDDIDPESFSRD